MTVLFWTLIAAAVALAGRYAARVVRYLRGRRKSPSQPYPLLAASFLLVVASSVGLVRDDGPTTGTVVPLVAAFLVLLAAGAAIVWQEKVAPTPVRHAHQRCCCCCPHAHAERHPAAEAPQ